jgi:hypothetical protein
MAKVRLFHTLTKLCLFPEKAKGGHTLLEMVALTDIARYRSSNPRITIHSWLRNHDVVEFLGLWEFLHNPSFKRNVFDTFKKDAGSLV